MDLLIQRLINAALRSDAEFGKEFKKALMISGIKLRDFSNISGIPLSTLKKVVSGKSSIRICTLRAIINGFKNVYQENYKDGFIAFLATRQVVERILSSRELASLNIKVKGYPVNTLDDVYKAAMKAVRDGAKAIVAAPIVSQMLQDFIDTPLVSVNVCENDIVQSIKIAASQFSAISQQR
jgi:predicted transcriptional regulator